jgi:hypothetical protein
MSLKSFLFSGSRNYVDEHVSNYIWEADPGTLITVLIREDDKCEVEVTKTTNQEGSQQVRKEDREATEES